MSLQEKQNIAENVMNESVESELNEKAEEKLSKLMARLQRLEKETNQLDEKPQPLPEDQEMEDIDNI
jgi:oligoendopeptidase F